MRLLDTDFCIELLRGNPEARERMESFGDDVGTTVMTAAELFYGAARSREPAANHDAVSAFLSDLPIITMSRDAAEIYGRIRAALEREGRRLPDMDLMIAAIALRESATLVTGNISHYCRIPDIMIEDYRQ